VTKIIQRGRLVVLAAVLAAGYLGLCWRLVLLQVVRGDELHDKAGRQHKLAVLKQPPRGDILDIKGNLLATSLSVKTVCVDPALLTNCQVEVARVVSPFLGLAEPELLRTFGNLAHWVTNDNTARAVTNHCLVLQRHVPVETWTNLEQVLLWNYKLNCTNALARKQMALEARNASRGWKRWLPGRPRTKLARLNDKDKLALRNVWLNAIFAVDDQLRHYPNKQLASHLLGFTVEKGFLKVGEIFIGENCYVGNHSVLNHDCEMKNNSHLDSQSMLSTNSVIPKNESWTGSPAKKDLYPDVDINYMVNVHV